VLPSAKFAPAAALHHRRCLACSGVRLGRHRQSRVYSCAPATAGPVAAVAELGEAVRCALLEVESPFVECEVFAAALQEFDREQEENEEVADEGVSARVGRRESDDASKGRETGGLREELSNPSGTLQSVFDTPSRLPKQAFLGNSLASLRYPAVTRVIEGLQLGISGSGSQRRKHE